MSSPITSCSFTPSSIVSEPVFDPTPDLRKATIDATGRLVFRPEHEHERLDYKARDTTGAYTGARLNIPDSDPFDNYTRQKFTNLQQSVKRNVQWLEKNFVAGTTKARDAYEAVATPAKKHYQFLKTVPIRFNAKLEMDNRAIKNELELLQLKLAETRLQLAEVRLRSKELGMSTCMRVVWAILFVTCLVPLAYLVDGMVLDLGFDAFEE